MCLLAAVTGWTITGTTTAAGTETFTVTATDVLGDTTSTNYNITVSNLISTPVLTGMESARLTYRQGDPATPVTAAITASDLGRQYARRGLGLDQRQLPEQ